MNAIVPAVGITPARRRRRASVSPSTSVAPADWTAGATHQELIGVLPDGRKVLWSTGWVRPITAFPRVPGGFIAGDHYVLDWNGHDITAYCSSACGGGVVVQVMCGPGTVVHPLAYVEARVRGVVLRDPVAEADMLRRMREIRRLLRESRDTPDRQRGRI